MTSRESPARQAEATFTMLLCTDGTWLAVHEESSRARAASPVNGWADIARLREDWGSIEHWATGPFVAMFIDRYGEPRAEISVAAMGHRTAVTSGSSADLPMDPEADHLDATAWSPAWRYDACQERCPMASMPIGSVAFADEPARPVLDAEIVGRLEKLGQAIDEDLLGQLIALFSADAAAQLVVLGRALMADDAVAVVGSAHAMRGASANLGATQLAHLCTRLEAAAAADDLSGAGLILEDIHTELARVRQAFRLTVPSQ